MTAWAAKLVDGLNAADERAQVLTGNLSNEQLNWRPTAGAWSIGQCLEHLCITNEQYLPAIEGSLAGKAKGSTEEILPGWFGRWFIASFAEPLGKTKKAKAPKKIAPTTRVDGAVLERLLAGNRNVRDLIERASEYDVNRIRFKNPFIPLIRFTVGTGLTIVVRHQHRHLLQAERVKAAEGFPR